MGALHLHQEGGVGGRGEEGGDICRRGVKQEDGLVLGCDVDVETFVAVFVECDRGHAQEAVPIIGEDTVHAAPVDLEAVAFGGALPGEDVFFGGVDGDAADGMAVADHVTPARGAGHASQCRDERGLPAVVGACDDIEAWGEFECGLFVRHVMLQDDACEHLWSPQVCLTIPELKIGCKGDQWGLFLRSRAEYWGVETSIRLRMCA